jgi:hypothetical protein
MSKITQQAQNELILKLANENNQMRELLKKLRPIVSDYDFRYHANGRELCDELYRLISDDEAETK